MISGSRSDRTLEDIDRTVRALAREFKTDKVFIVGSQSILLSWPNAPTLMTSTPEIDAYVANAKTWEMEEKTKYPDEDPLASEHIHGLFGEGSQFHETHFFYIDGVDENTAILPLGWQERAIIRSVDVDGREVFAVAPCPDDIIVSKLARLADKDKEFIEAYHAARPLNLKTIEARLELTSLDPALAERARQYMRNLVKTRIDPTA